MRGLRLIKLTMNPEPSTDPVASAASLLGRKAKGVKKTLTEAQREAMRERMQQINEAKRKAANENP